MTSIGTRARSAANDRNKSGACSGVVNTSFT